MAEILYIIELQKISKNAEQTVEALNLLNRQVAMLNKTMLELVTALKEKNN